MAQSEESLLYYKTYPATAESQLTALLSLMVNDLRKKGSFVMETSGHYDRMSAVAYGDSFVSVASFKGDGGILNGD